MSETNALTLPCLSSGPKDMLEARSNIPSDTVATAVKNNLGVNIAACCPVRGTHPAIQSILCSLTSCLLPQHISVSSTWTQFGIFFAVFPV